MGCKQVKVRSAAPENIEFDNVALTSELSTVTRNQRASTAISKVSFDIVPLDKASFLPAVYYQRLRAIDNKAYRTAINEWCPSSLAELIQLIESLSSDSHQIDRAWIIFYWISQNINYDADAFSNNRTEMQDAETVFKNKLALCEGYTSLYAELCNRTGIKCHIISGYAKGFGFDIRQRKFDKTNHTWNMITLDTNHSYFVEPTWGSGYFDHASHQYKRRLVPHYFLCRPEHMIYKHLPKDYQWQFLENPLTLKQYLMLPMIYPIFFALDLLLVSPVNSAKVRLVEGEAYGLVLIHTSNDKVELTGVLKDNLGNKIDGGSLTYRDKKGQTLWHCRFAPPTPGKYSIFIFAREKDNQDQSSFSSAIQFAFDVDRLPTSTISYPFTWPQFFEYNIEIIKPINSRYIDWPSDNNNSCSEIIVRSPNDICLSATLKDTVNNTNVENGTLTNYNHQTNQWECLFAPSSAAVPFELTLFAQQSNEENSHCVAQFDLRPIPNDSLNQCMTFPLAYSPFNQSKCHLYEPLNGVLQKDSTVHFRCQIPNAEEVNITADRVWIPANGLKPGENDVFESDIRVGLNEVAVWVKFKKEKSSYEGLLKYIVR